VPLKLIVEVVPVDELLVKVTAPLTAPAVVGSNTMLSVAELPALSVSGKLTPEIENPVPETVAALIVTEDVPVELSVTVCVSAVFRETLPKATLVVCSVNVATDDTLRLIA
jgi:hypothetical protein